MENCLIARTNGTILSPSLKQLWTDDGMTLIADSVSIIREINIDMLELRQPTQSSYDLSNRWIKSFAPRDTKADNSSSSNPISKKF